MAGRGPCARRGVLGVVSSAFSAQGAMIELVCKSTHVLKGQHYMLPDTAEAEQVRLYKGAFVFSQKVLTPHSGLTRGTLEDRQGVARGCGIAQPHSHQLGRPVVPNWW